MTYDITYVQKFEMLRCRCKLYPPSSSVSLYYVVDNKWSSPPSLLTESREETKADWTENGQMENESGLYYPQGSYIDTMGLTFFSSCSLITLACP